MLESFWTSWKKTESNCFNQTASDWVSDAETLSDMPTLGCLTVSGDAL